MSKKIVIVGGVAGGASAAARLRRLDETCEIVIVEKGNYVSYANCGLPYYIGGEIEERDRLFVQTKEGMSKRFNIDIRTNSEVITIDKENKTITIKSDNKNYTENYDYLVLSPGASPFVPPIEGINLDGIYTVRNVEDTDKIKDIVTKKQINSAVVIGGGFIGIEMAENLKRAKIKTKIVEAMDQIMPPYDVEMSKMIEHELFNNEIEVITNDAVTKISKSDNLTLELKSGKKINADMIVLAIGVRPESGLAKEAGLEIGSRGGIKVDEYMRTSDEFIYAVGDVVEVYDPINGSLGIVPLAGPANKQGRIAADNICGRKVSYDGTIGTSIIKVFGITAASCGNNEKTLKKFNIPYLKSYTHSNSHAGYYPGAYMMAIKLLFSPKDGKILGSQIVGVEGVDKRIDVIATALKNKMTIYDLEDLELAYAPPYSSAKDPVNMAGFTAENILNGDMKVIHFDEIETIDKNENVILDVRTPMEYETGFIEGSVNIPVDDLRDRLGELPKDKRIIVYCKIGLRGYIACRILMQKGYNAVNLSGGYDLYMASKYEGILDNNVEMAEIKKVSTQNLEANIKNIKIDACGLQCPGPIMRVYNEIQKVDEGSTLEVHVTDAAFSKDIKYWCDKTGNTLLGVDKTCCDYVAYIKKGKLNKEDKEVAATNINAQQNDNKTIVVFSGDLDKALASFIIANGAASMGKKVTMFFTFWGLNILRKDQYVKVKKTFIEKMFGSMMPRGSKKLKISKMNMGGMGTVMIKKVMKQKNVQSLEELMQMALKNNVKFIACSMSMDIMGIKQEELIDGVEIGGVASYLGEAEDSNVNLFI